MLRVAEHVRGGLIDGHSTAVGSGVGLLLTYMELEGLKVKFLVAHNLVLSFI